MKRRCGLARTGSSIPPIDATPACCAPPLPTPAFKRVAAAAVVPLTDGAAEMSASGEPAPGLTCSDSNDEGGGVGMVWRGMRRARSRGGAGAGGGEGTGRGPLQQDP
eukprot:365942-Chlamydomonas_euryale.AAC.2